MHAVGRFLLDFCKFILNITNYVYETVGVNVDLGK